MNKHNKEKFNKLKKMKSDSKMTTRFLNSLTFKQQIYLSIGVLFKTRRAICFLSCLDGGISPFSAHNIAYGNTIQMLLVY